MNLRTNERGSAAILVAVMLAVLMGFLGLAVDVGHFMKVRGELQNSADAAALAGARELTGAAGCGPRARASATDYAFRHLSDTSNISVSPGEIQLGTMVSAGNGGWQFQQIADETLCDQISAVRVVAARGTGSLNPTVPVFFNRIYSMFGTANSTQDINALAVAAVGGECGECVFPFAIPDCAAKPGGVLNCTDPLILRSDSVDLWAITSLDQNVDANGAAAAAVINSPLHCRDVQTGYPIPIQNGNDYNSQLRTAIMSFCHIAGPANRVSWPQPCHDAQGQPPMIVMPIVDANDSPNCKLNQHPTVVGFATYTIDSVSFDTGRGAVPYVKMLPDCKVVDPAPEWCPMFGASAFAKLYQ